MTSQPFPSASTKSPGTLEHSNMMHENQAGLNPVSSLCGNPSVALLSAPLARLQAKSLHFLSKYFEVMCVQTYLHVSFEVLMMYSQPGTKFQFVLSHHCFHGLVLTVTAVPNLHGCFYGYVYSAYKCMWVCLSMYIHTWEGAKEGKLLSHDTAQH